MAEGPSLNLSPAAQVSMFRRMLLIRKAKKRLSKKLRGSPDSNSVSIRDA
jgi:hypothetical protein